MKTLRGLQPVDVILSKVPGRLADPLELETGSHIGVPGLLDAMRAGRVRVANDPGAAVLEAPGLAAFVPALGAPVLDLLAPKPGERILDLGCGDGVLTQRLIEAGCDVVGVDADPAMVAAARAKGLDARIGDARALNTGSISRFTPSICNSIDE